MKTAQKDRRTENLRIGLRMKKRHGAETSDFFPDGARAKSMWEGLSFDLQGRYHKSLREKSVRKGN